MKKLFIIMSLLAISIPASMLSIVYKKVCPDHLVGRKSAVTYIKYDNNKFIISCGEDPSDTSIICKDAINTWIDVGRKEFTKLKWEYKHQPTWMKNQKPPKK